MSIKTGRATKTHGYIVDISFNDQANDVDDIMSVLSLQISKYIYVCMNFFDVSFFLFL